MLAFSNDYYGFIFRATQSVEVFCAYFIWVRQNKGNDSRCIYFEGKNPSVLTGEILAITANAIFEMPRKDGIYTMASYLEKYQVLDELKKIDKFKSEGKI